MVQTFSNSIQQEGTNPAEYLTKAMPSAFKVLRQSTSTVSATYSAVFYYKRVREHRQPQQYWRSSSPVSEIFCPQPGFAHSTVSGPLVT